MEPKALLTDWIQLKHKGQQIRETAEPYFNHLIFVAETVANLIPFGFEIGICHDLLEDTATTATELEQQIVSFGYGVGDAAFITNCVVELTDVFTKKAYPKLRKATRKEHEAKRLISISPAAQTVKYADLIYNIDWVLKYTPTKALKYLQKKEVLVIQMNKGDAPLRQKVLKLLKKSLKDFMVR